MTLFAAGQRVTALALNNALPIHCGVTASAFNLPSSASVYTALAWALQSSSNTTGMWSAGAPTKLFAPTAGTYNLGGIVTFPGTLSTFDGRGEFRTNGSGTAVSTAKVSTVRGSSGNTSGAISGTVILNAGEYVELYLNQGSGSTCSMIAALSMSRESTSTT